MLNPLKLLSKFIKSNNEKELDRLKKIGKKVNDLEEDIIKLENEVFPKKTEELIEKINNGSSLDEILYTWNLPCPNYLKIDVDGIESKIIYGAKKTLKNDDLKSILIEININRDEDKDIINILKKNNFTYSQDQVNESERKTGPHKGYAEYLFIRK